MIAKLYLFKVVMGLSAAFILAGCQQKLSQPAPEVKIKQISALVASSSYLKKNCKRSDIPEDNILIDKALYLSSQKGWSIDENQYNQLINKIQERYQSLLKDDSPHMQKCAQLEKLVTPFLDEAKRG
ncbi:type II secretion system pilot lipoprotein GspS [Yersinia enterocolitica]|uniref:type II secretion system pilot lipoprotein GspS n=1 Tax=Yersinia enterocolitica TaxID=630 RepID=UPI00398C91FD